VLEGVPRGPEVAGDDPVQNVEAGRVLGGDRDVLPPGRLEPAELDGEHVLEQVAQHEHRHGDAEQRSDRGQVVDPRLRSSPGYEAERDADDDGEQDRRAGQLERRLEPAGDLLRDRLLGLDRDAEVELDDLAHVAEVLLVDRPVQAVRRPHLRDPLRS